MSIDIATKEVYAPWPDTMTGYSGLPEYASWLQKTSRGEPVTIDEHNVMVLHLAWLRDIFATPPLDVPVIATPTRSVPFPFAVSGMGDAAKLMLGAQPYTPGEIVLPRAGAAGAAVPPPVTPPTTGGSFIVVPNAQRSAYYQNVSALAEGLSLGNLRLSVGPAQTQPAGWLWPALAGGALLVGAGVFAYALFSRYEQAQVDTAVQTARVHEDGMTARRVQELQAAYNATAQRYAYAQQTGQMPDPSPLESAPTANIPPENPPNPSPTGLPSSLAVGGLALTVGALFGGGYVLQDRRAKRAALTQLV